MGALKSGGVTAALVGALLATTSIVPAADVTFERLRHPEPQNWLMNHGDFSAHRYSSLDQINKSNVKNLKVAFTWAMGGTAGGGKDVIVFPFAGLEVPQRIAWRPGRNRVLVDRLLRGGVKADDDIVVDFNPMNQLFGGSPIAPIVSSFDASHAVTKDMRGAQIMFPQGRSLGLAPKLPEGWQATALAKAMPSAWGWTGLGSKVPTKAGPSDLKGPLDLIYALEGPAKAFDASAMDGKVARLVVFGTSQMFANQLVVAFNNQDFIVNSVRWLADEEKRIAIAPKAPENSPLLLDSSRLKLIWWSFILLSLAALGAGISVTVLRRSAA